MAHHLLLKSFVPAGGTAHELGTVNVLVGPNGVGKSETLRDFVRLVGNYDTSGEERAKGEEPKTRVIQDVHFVSKLSMDRLLQGVTSIEAGGEEGRVAQGVAPDLKSAYRRTIPTDLKNILFRPTITSRSVWTTGLGDIMPLRVAYLAAEERTRLIQPTAAASPLRPPQSLLAALQYADPSVHERLDAAIRSILDGPHVVLDASERVQLALRTADQVPGLTGDPLEDAQAFSRLEDVNLQGDGFQHVVAIVLAMLVCQGRVILIDQPEIALDHEVSRRLAVWIAENATTLGCQFIIATQDPYFLSGLFSGGSDVHVWRMSRRDDFNRFDPVPAEAGRALATFPLFTSQLAVSCLMRDGVIVSPEGADRVVYQAVAERVLKTHNIGFVHAHGSRNLNFVTTAFRRANIPTCVVAEFDVLQSESQFSELVKALSGKPAGTPWLATRERLVSHVEGRFDEAELSATSNEVEAFLDNMKQPQQAGQSQRPARSATTAAKWDRLRRERLGILPPEMRIWVEELLEDLKRIGLFISPKGKLQGWIAFAADEEDPDGWLNRAMQLLYSGDCPPDLRVFVAEMAAQIRASSPPPRSTRRGHGT